jgi:hypothetical protein
LKNWLNEFQITFIDITGKINYIELTSDIQQLISFTNSYEDKSIFTDKVKEIFNYFINFLDINNFNFEILIFKSNWRKDWDENNCSNNVNYDWKLLKIA